MNPGPNPPVGLRAESHVSYSVLLKSTWAIVQFRVGVGRVVGCPALATRLCDTNACVPGLRLSQPGRPPEKRGGRKSEKTASGRGHLELLQAGVSGQEGGSPHLLQGAPGSQGVGFPVFFGVCAIGWLPETPVRGAGECAHPLPAPGSTWGSRKRIGK